MDADTSAALWLEEEGGQGGALSHARSYLQGNAMD